jgi:thiol-disulfide isomerase/thioredoxin
MGGYDVALGNLIVVTVLITTQLALAEPVKEFTLPNISGGEASLSQLLDGKQISVTAFWCGGCDECKALVPFLIELRKDFAEDQVGIFVIAADTYFSESETADIFKQAGSTYQVLLDDGGRVGKAFKVKRYPMLMLLSPEHNIVWANIGFGAGAGDAVKAALEDLLDGKAVTGGNALGQTSKEQEQYERDAKMIWRRFVGKCKNGYLWEIDDEFARLGFTIIDEGIEDTQHGKQPYHVWEGYQEYHNTVFTVNVHLTYGRANWHFYNVLVDGQVWGTY